MYILQAVVHALKSTFQTYGNIFNLLFLPMEIIHDTCLITLKIHQFHGDNIYSIFYF